MADEAQFAKNVPPALRQALKEDLAFVRTIESDGDQQSKRNQALYEGMSGKSYLDWFEDRIDTIGYAGDQGPLPFAFVDYRMPNELWLTDNVVKHSVPQAWRVGIMWHEARHSESENGNWSHINCPKNLLDREGKPLRSGGSGILLAGYPGCDDTADGAYGTSATMLGNIHAYCTSCTEKIRSDADLFFDDSVNRMVTDDLRDVLLADLNHD
jgi:hypothetical protein